MAKITQKEHILAQDAQEEQMPVSPADPEQTPTPDPDPEEPTEPDELGITLPDEAAPVEQLADTDRLLAFDTDGNPLTATAQQLKDFAAEGLVSEEALAAALEGKFSVVQVNEGRPEPNNFGVVTGLSGNFGAPLYGAPLLSFGAPGYEAQIILGGIGAWEGAWNRIYFRNRNGDSGAVSDWKEFYHSGNLTPATAASVGLMSDEDKIKLNAVASAMSLSEDEPATMALNQEESVSSEISIRAQRSARYQMQTDELLYDALEAFARNHPEYTEFAEWIAAKDRIRAELAKPETLNLE